MSQTHACENVVSVSSMSQIVHACENVVSVSLSQTCTACENVVLSSMSQTFSLFILNESLDWFFFFFFVYTRLLIGSFSLLRSSPLLQQYQMLLLCIQVKFLLTSANVLFRALSKWLLIYSAINICVLSYTHLLIGSFNYILVSWLVLFLFLCLNSSLDWFLAFIHIT